MMPLKIWALLSHLRARVRKMAFHFVSCVNINGGWRVGSERSLRLPHVPRAPHRGVARRTQPSQLEAKTRSPTRSVCRHTLQASGSGGTTHPQTGSVLHACSISTAPHPPGLQRDGQCTRAPSARRHTRPAYNETANPFYVLFLCPCGGPFDSVHPFTVTPHMARRQMR